MAQAPETSPAFEIKFTSREVSAWGGMADDPDIQGWRYGAMVTRLSLPPVEICRSYRGRADCENRIKELKNDFGLDSFNHERFLRHGSRAGQPCWRTT